MTSLRPKKKRYSNVDKILDILFDENEDISNDSDVDILNDEEYKLNDQDSDWE